MKLTLPAHIYYGLIERFTTPTDRLIANDRGIATPGGSIEFELDPCAQAAIDAHRLAGETYQDAIERLLAVRSGHLS
jgi:hypothetical protein